jgi:NADPH:quinone reductase-like Zn-dependent oxidoreductase
MLRMRDWTSGAEDALFTPDTTYLSGILVWLSPRRFAGPVPPFAGSAPRHPPVPFGARVRPEAKKGERMNMDALAAQAVPARAEPYGRIAVLGAGSWGTALAAVARTAGREVTLWGRDEAVLAAVSLGENPRYLPGVPLPGGIKATADLAEAVAGAEAVLVDDGSGPSPGLPGGARAKLAFDAVGGAATERLAAMVADGGTVVTYGLLSGESPRLSAHDLVFRGLTLRGFWLADWFAQASPERARDVFGRLTGWLAEGRIGARVAARYPLERVAEAVADAAREGRDGKILLTANGGGG